MEIRHIRYFLAVAEEGHFTRAAQRLHVSQPTLSHQIRQLEEDLGSSLFDRAGKRVRLTPAGEIFREHAAHVVREIEAARVAIDELEGLGRGAVAVGAVQTVHAYLMPRIVSSFAASYPSIGVFLRELPAGEVEARLASGELDLGVGFTPPSLAEIDAEPLFAESLVLIVPAGHRLSGRRRVRLAELDGEPLVLLSREYCTRRLVDESFRSAGAAPRVTIEMNAIEGILETVRAGRSATILPERVLAGGPRDGLSAVALADPAPVRQVALLWRRGAHRSAAARAFAAEVRALDSAPRVAAAARRGA